MIENNRAIGDVKNTPMLLSAARREFLNRSKWAGGKYSYTTKPYMALMTEFFGRIGSELYSTGFLWSDYNKGVWKGWVECHDAFGGAGMFSLEPDGHWDESIDTLSFKGLSVGGPLGYFPYEIVRDWWSTEHKVNWDEHDPS